MILVPSTFFFTTGKGVHDDPLVAEELAYREAGIAPTNMVKVSSILAPGCKHLEKNETEKEIHRKLCQKYIFPGEVLFMVASKNNIDGNDSSTVDSVCVASVGMASPSENTNHIGYLTEYHATDRKTKKFGNIILPKEEYSDEKYKGFVKDHAEESAVNMLISVLGVKDFDINKAYDEESEMYNISKDVIKSGEITTDSIAVVTEATPGKHTFILAAACFLDYRLMQYFPEEDAFRVAGWEKDDSGRFGLRLSKETYKIENYVQVSKELPDLINI